MKTNNFNYDPYRVDEEVCRMLCAAVVSKDFRGLMLDNPALAIELGYQGEKFRITNQDKQWIGQIRATSLAEFAQQVTDQAILNRPQPAVYYPAMASIVE